MHVPLSVYLPYLALTLAIEVPVALALLLRRSGIRRALLSALLASLITHPLLWYGWDRVVSRQAHYVAYVASGEALVVLIEAGVYFAIALAGPRIGLSKLQRIGGALGVSAVANLASWGTGMLMYAFGWLRTYEAVASRAVESILGCF